MLIRIIAIIALILLLTVPIYHLLKHRLFKVFRELEDDTPSLDERLDALDQKWDHLLEDTIFAEKTARKTIQNAQTIKSKIQGKNHETHN